VARISKAAATWMTALLLVPTAASGAVTYEATAIAPSGSYTELHGVSDTGVVVGYVESLRHVEDRHGQ
jgi:hypothetical protein